MQHAFSELVDNAIEHSGGPHVTVSLRQTRSQAQLLVSDDGVGIFGRITECFAIADPELAMLELAKGKLTSQPERHSGHGLFFTAQLADVFDLQANDAAFQRRAWDGRGGWPKRAAVTQGSPVYAAFLLETPLTIEAVRQAHSADGRGYGYGTASNAPSCRCGCESRRIAGSSRGLRRRGPPPDSANSRGPISISPACRRSGTRSSTSCFGSRR